MSLGLDKIDIGPGGASTLPPEPDRLRMAGSVRRSGIVALILAAAGLFIPILGFLMLIVAMLMSRHALKDARDYLVPDEDERYAKWASSLSTVFLLFNAIGLVLLLLRS